MYAWSQPEFGSEVILIHIIYVGFTSMYSLSAVLIRIALHIIRCPLISNTTKRVIWRWKATAVLPEVYLACYARLTWIITFNKCMPPFSQFWQALLRIEFVISARLSPCAWLSNTSDLLFRFEDPAPSGIGSPTVIAHSTPFTEFLLRMSGSLILCLLEISSII